MRIIVGLIFILVNVFAANGVMIQFEDIKVLHQHENTQESIILSRIKKECANVHANPETVYGGDIVAKDVPEACKKTFVTTVGKIQPMQIAKGVQTVGELEVLDFIKNKLNKNPEKYILVDARRIDWFEKVTIPGATNISYDSMVYDEEFPEDWKRFLELLNIKMNGKKMDFSHAKTMVIFCNANWCVQSPTAIKTLLSYGYPASKILWYRGGIQSWILSGFNAIKPK